jgi:GntR family transcriptional repressor for pyruvate dehydrogenase complex
MTNDHTGTLDHTRVEAFRRIRYRPETLADRAVEEIRTLIEDGRLPVGERLPSERELVELLGISRTILREALSSLEALGFIERRSTRGRFIAEGGPSGRSRALVGAWLHQHAAEISELDDVRALIESHALLALAPVNAPELAERLRTILDDQQRAIERRDPAGAAAADTDFHKLLCSASPNATLLDLAFALIDRSRRISLAAYTLPELSERALAEHRRVADALVCGDVDAGAERLRTHILASSRRNLGTGEASRSASQGADPRTSREPTTRQESRR